MLNRRYILAFFVLLPLVLAGCRVETINYFPPKDAHVRVVNALPDASALTITVDSTVAWSALPFEAMTTYMDFSNEMHNFSATVPGATSPLVQATFNLSGTSSYTLVTFGTVESPAMVLLSDDTIAPTAGRFLLRVANVAAGSAPLDMYLTAPGAALDNIAPVLSDVIYTGSTGFIQLNAGTYQVRLTQTGTKTVVYDSGTRTFADNTSTDAIVYTRSGGLLVNLILDDINAGQQVVVNSTLAELKIVNTAFATGAVNTFLDGAAIAAAANLAYPAATTYNIVPPGPHTVTFEATATPGATVASVAPTLVPATQTSVFVTGFAGALSAVPLSDLNWPAPNSNPRLRVVNASPDAPPIDILLNGTRQIGSLAFPTASGYVENGAATYTITINNTATGATLLTLSGVALLSGQTSTLYVAGPATQLTGLLTRDF